MKQHPGWALLVTTYLPSAEPFTPDAEAVTQWLSNFHIVVTE